MKKAQYGVSYHQSSYWKLIDLTMGQELSASSILVYSCPRYIIRGICARSHAMYFCQLCIKLERRLRKNLKVKKVIVDAALAPLF